MKISSIKSTKFISNVKNSSKAHNYIKKIFWWNTEQEKTTTTEDLLSVTNIKYNLIYKHLKAIISFLMNILYGWYKHYYKRNCSKYIGRTKYPMAFQYFYFII